MCDSSSQAVHAERINIVQSVQQHSSGNPRLSEGKHILRIRWMIVSTRLAMEVPWTQPRIRREQLATKATCDVTGALNGDDRDGVDGPSLTAL